MIGTLLFTFLRTFKENTVYLDGDKLREVLGNSRGYEPHERKALALSYARLCKMLAEQGLDVVCATISMFNEVREWNRKEINNYCEIYLDVPLKVLKTRNQKGLYHGVPGGEAANVVGLNLDFEAPRSPDMVIKNDGSRTAEEIVRDIVCEFELDA